MLVLPPPPPPPPLTDVVLFGSVIFTIFVAFIPSQAFATVMFGSFGALGVIILYTCFCISNFLAPVLVQKLGISIAMTLGAIGYLPFVLALALHSEVLFIIGSITCGSGAGLLWVGIGCSVTVLSTSETRGSRFGVFSFINRMNFIGSLLVGILFSTGVEKSQVFWYLFCILGLGCVLLGTFGRCVLVPLALRPKHKTTPTPTTTTTSSTNCATILKMFGRTKFLPYLCSNFVCNGLVKGWVFAVLTTWAPNNESVGYMMAIFGCLIVVSVLSMGLLFDCLTTLTARTGLLFVSIACGLLGVLAAFHYRLLSPESTVGYLVSAVFFGLMTGGLEATVQAGTSFMYPIQTSSAFAAKLLTECFGQVCGYLIEAILGDTNDQGQFILLTLALVVNAVVVLWSVCRTNGGGVEVGVEAKKRKSSGGACRDQVVEEIESKSEQQVIYL